MGASRTMMILGFKFDPNVRKCPAQGKILPFSASCLRPEDRRGLPTVG